MSVDGKHNYFHLTCFLATGLLAGQSFGSGCRRLHANAGGTRQAGSQSGMHSQYGPDHREPADDACGQFDCRAPGGRFHASCRRGERTQCRGGGAVPYHKGNPGSTNQRNYGRQRWCALDYPTPGPME